MELQHRVNALRTGIITAMEQTVVAIDRYREIRPQLDQLHPTEESIYFEDFREAFLMQYRAIQRFKEVLTRKGGTAGTDDD